MCVLYGDWVKSQQLLGDNTKLKEWLKKQLEKEHDKNSIVDHVAPASEIDIDLSPLEDRRIPEDCFYSDYDEDTLQAVMDQQMEMVTVLKSHGKSKHMANRLLIIFDDLVGSRLFSNKRGNPFKKLNTNHRHYSASLIMVSQAFVFN